MNKCFYVPLVILSLLLGSCIGEEPKNMECDIEMVSVHFDDVSLIFYHDYDSLVSVPFSSDSIGFSVRPKAKVTLVPITLSVTEGARIYLGEDNNWNEFLNGSAVDFSDNQIRMFRIVSEDGKWHKDYRICFINDKVSTSSALTLYFNFDGNYALDDPNSSVTDKKHYFVWTETDTTNVNELFGSESWKCGNPGFKLSMSSATAMQYPTIPVEGGGPDGSDCVKLETKDTGAFGKMVNMLIAAGSLFNGYFDVTNALKNARKATLFGLPFKHKPTHFSVWLKCEMGAPYQDKLGATVDGVIDEPDAYVVVYRNQDEDGKQVQLDGDDVLTSKYIVGIARLPHNYYYEEEDGRMVRRDLVGNNPIHGVTSEWKKFDMEVEYTEELNAEVLANNGYSMIIGFASSWQGAYFTGAVGSKLWIDNITIDCEY